MFQDVSDPEYAQLQDALKSKASIPQKARPIIHAIAVIEEPKATLSETKGKMPTRSPSRGSLRLAHSAEDVSTLERLSRRGEKEPCQKKKVGEGRKLAHCNFLFPSYHQLVCFRKTKRSCDRGPKSAFTLLTCSHIGFNLGKWQNYFLALGRELDVTPSKTISMSML